MDTDFMEEKKKCKHKKPICQYIKIGFYYDYFNSAIVTPISPSPKVPKRKDLM